MMLLPHGYSGLKSELGQVIRAARKCLRMKQEMLAVDVMISRETLSRIERGRIPRPQVLERLMVALELDWSNVADEGHASSARPFVDGYRGDLFSQFGNALQACRKAESRSLRDLSKQLGLSASTLSRIERGHGSRVYREWEGYEEIDLDERPFEITHSNLDAYLSG
jgi:transcriptional regulator with XRE-family HTH domain